VNDLRNVSPDVFREQRYREGKFNCDICLMEWPMSHQVEMRGGDRVGRLCCFEPDGDEMARDLRRAFASRQAARIAMTRALPPRAPDGVIYPGPTAIVDEGYIIDIDPRPVVLSRGGAAVAVTLTAVGAAADDEIEYGAAGITDASAASLTDDVWTLSVQASADMATGIYKLTYNDSIWQAVFDVR
jgi:methyl coenzyme M reductase alpha subunit